MGGVTIMIWESMPHDGRTPSVHTTVEEKPYIWVPRGSKVVLFFGCPLFLVRDSNILPQKELLWSLRGVVKIRVAH